MLAPLECLRFMDASPCPPKGMNFTFKVKGVGRITTIRPKSMTPEERARLVQARGAQNRILLDGGR